MLFLINNGFISSSAGFWFPVGLVEPVELGVDGFGRIGFAEEETNPTGPTKIGSFFIFTGFDIDVTLALKLSIISPG